MSRVWPLEALAWKRGVNELAAYLRMLGDRRTCSLLYLSRRASSLDPIDPLQL